MGCEDSALEKVLEQYQLPALKNLSPQDMPAYVRQIENAIFAALYRIELMNDQMQSAMGRLCDYVASLIDKVPEDERERIYYLKDAPESEETYLEVNVQNICELSETESIGIFGTNYKEVLEKTSLTNRLYDEMGILEEAQQQYLSVLIRLTTASMPFEQKNIYRLAQVYVVHSGDVYKFVIGREDGRILQDLDFMVLENDFKKEEFMQKLKTAYELHHQNVYVASNASELVLPSSIIHHVLGSLQEHKQTEPSPVDTSALRFN